MKPLQLSLLLSGGVIVVGAFVLLSSPSEVEPPEPPVEQTEVDGSRTARASSSLRTGSGGGTELRQRQSALRHDVRDLRQQVEQMREDASASESPADMAVSTAPEPEPEPELTGQEYDRAVADGFEEQLEEQAVDPEWAQARREAFDSFFATDKVAGARLGEVICGSTLCRLEISLDTHDDRRLLLDEVSGLLEANAHGFAHIEDDDDLEIQVYLGRADTALPVTEG